MPPQPLPNSAPERAGHASRARAAGLLRLLLAWAFLAGTAWAQSGSPPLAGDTIRVGLLERFPPFYDWQGGRPVGLDVDLLAELSRRTGLRFEYVRFGDFPSLLAALRAGSIRLSTATAQTPERALDLRFTRPYASVQQAFVGDSAITSVPSTPDLAGRRLAVVRGYVSESISAERFPAASRPAYPDVEAALAAVERGDADFAFEALPTLRSLLAERPRSHLAVLRTYGFPEGHLRLVGGLRDAPLMQQLDAALLDMAPQGLQRLREKWLPAQAPAGPAAAPPAPAGGGDIRPLRVGFLSSDAPFTMELRPGEADGVGIRMMKAVAQRAGLQISAFEPIDLASGLEALSQGRLDIMLGLTDTAERRKHMAFVGPYRANPLILVSRRAYSVWDLGQLAGQRLAVPKGAFLIPYLRSAYPTVEIVECARFGDCQAMVEQGQADAALHGLQSSFALLQARVGSTLAITGTVPGLYDEHNIGLSLARAPLATRLRDALNAVLQQDMRRIEREWSDQESQHRTDWRLVRQAVALGLAALLLLAAAWWWHSRRLRREITRTQQARRETEQYLAFMAHEVRNSLQSVNGAMALLRGAARPDARQQPLLEALGRSARATLGLLNGLLDRHRLHAGRLALDLRPESLEQCLRAVLDEAQPAAQAKGLQLRFERSGPLEGWWRIDALRLQQILRNLLVNAVKFSSQGSITLRAALQASKRGDDWRTLEIQVRDQGPGIDQARLPQAFEAFSPQGGDRPGSGLGLALSRELARALGGELSVRSPPGQGAEFTLRFDLQQAPLPSPGASLRGQRLLVVEDSAVYGLLLRQAFANLGATVELAETVQAARACLAASVAGPGAQPFSLVLCDTQLGDGRADDLLNALRQAPPPGTAWPPVVCMSAEFDAGMTTLLVQAGAADLISKDSNVMAFASRVLTSVALSPRDAAA